MSGFVGDEIRVKAKIRAFLIRPSPIIPFILIWFFDAFYLVCGHLIPNTFLHHSSLPNYDTLFIPRRDNEDGRRNPIFTLIVKVMRLP